MKIRNMSWIKVLLMFLLKSQFGRNYYASSELGNTLRKKRNVLNSIVLSASEKNVALLRHNDARRVVQPSSSDMMKLIWDDELAKTAQEYSRKCSYEHSSNITTSKFKNVGENLYISSPEVAPEIILEEAIAHWDSEKFYYNFSAHDCSDVCGHYTQLVWDTTYAVGCGLTTCSSIEVDGKIWPVGQLVVCHYGPTGNINNRRPYRIGTSCSLCPRNYWCESRLCNTASRLESMKFEMMCLLYYLFFTLLS